MLPPVNTLQTAGLVVLSFLIGFIAKTIIPFEYKRFRRASIESEKDVEEWKTRTLELVQEVRVRESELRSDRSTDLESKADEIRDLQVRIAKHARGAPDGVDDGLVDDLMELSAHVGSVPFVYREFSVAFPETIEGLEKIPFESEYDSASVKVGDEHVRLGPIIREMTSKMFNDRIMPLVSEIEEQVE